MIKLTELHGRKLRHFKNETPTNYRLAVDAASNVRAAAEARAAEARAVESSERRIDIPAPMILDQRLLDMIEPAGTGKLLDGCDFVIFENSPKSQDLCRRK